jgi:hypothetical protein
MNAYKVDAIRQSRRYTKVTESGLSILAGLPLPVGSSVEVIILDNGTIDLSRIVDISSSSASPADYLVGISSLMTEWESAADQSAYQDL